MPAPRSRRLVMKVVVFGLGYVELRLDPLLSQVVVEVRR
jgi:hypothetical protein